ncbi:hypothetical protein ACIODS_12405 [Micromonospora chalcea]|uniref:hypothetical protein n=1 Tax=Micromonospora chalcea TaxID=1874 RepID=UPI003820A889
MDVNQLARRIRDGVTLPQRCPQHTTYVAGCEGCKHAARIRSQARHRARTYGWIPAAHLPADQARQHIHTLRDSGMSLESIASRAGVAWATVRNIADGSTPRSHRTTIAAILAVTLTPAAPPRGHVLAVGSARRLQALTLAGYSSDDLAGPLDALPEVVRRWRSGTLTFIAERRHHDIAALADRLDGTRGGSQRARTYALRQGWHPLAAWDAIDNPDDRPSAGSAEEPAVDVVAVDRALAGARVLLTAAERRYAVHVGRERGMSTSQIATALHLAARSVTRLAAQPLPVCELVA